MSFVAPKLIFLLLLASAARAADFPDEDILVGRIDSLRRNANQLLRECEDLHRSGVRIVPSVLAALPPESWAAQVHRRLLRDDPFRAEHLGRPVYDTEHLIRYQLYMFAEHVRILRTVFDYRGEPFRIGSSFTRTSHAFLNAMSAVRFYLGALRESYAQSMGSLSRLAQVRDLANQAFAEFLILAQSPLFASARPGASSFSSFLPIRNQATSPVTEQYESFPFYEFPRENEAGTPFIDFDYTNYLTGYVITPVRNPPPPARDDEDPEAWNRRWTMQVGR